MGRSGFNENDQNIQVILNILLETRVSILEMKMFSE